MLFFLFQYCQQQLFGCEHSTNKKIFSEKEENIFWLFVFPPPFLHVVIVELEGDLAASVKITLNFWL